MARPQGSNQQAEVREDWGEEADNTYQGALRRLPWYDHARISLRMF